MDTTPRAVEIPPLRLQALLGVPGRAIGLVIFAHGSGSGRLSPRNQRVAGALREAGIATLLLDLLHPAEEGDRERVFDIALVPQRNRLAQAQLGGRSELAIVPGATHLFEEPGTLDEVTRLARDWFVRYLKVRPGQ